MTARDAALQILRDYGIRSLDPAVNANNLNGRPVGTGDLQSVVGYLNGALEEIYNDGPASIRQRPGSGVLRPGTAITLDVTQYSATVANLTTWADWMIGCTVRISGDEYDNEILSSTKLARPFMGSTGSKTATVWGDCMEITGDVAISHLITPVQLVGSSDLAIVGTREEFDGRSSGDSWAPGTTPSPTFNKQTGIPSWGFVDTIARDASGGTGVPKYLRVSPLPSQAFAVRYQAKVLPPTIAVTDIDNGDHTSDPLKAFPVDWQQSVLIAIARQRATSDPLNITAARTREEIFRQFQIARAILLGERPGVTAREARYE